MEKGAFVINNIKDINWRSECPISSALDVLGDKWAMLIIRDLIIHGTRTYSEFLEAPEHISTNILASKLKMLTCMNLITRNDQQVSNRNNAFRLTESGMALQPIIEEIGKWAHNHLKKFHTEMGNVSLQNEEVK